MSSDLQVHESVRCPDCDSFGEVAEYRTRSNADTAQRRTSARVWDCWECETRWVEYV